MFQVKSLGQNWEQNLTLTEHPILILFSMVNSSAHLSAFRPLEAAGPCLTSRFHRPDVHTVRNKALLSTYTHKGRVDGGKEKRATRYSPGSFLSQLEKRPKTICIHVVQISLHLHSFAGGYVNLSKLLLFSQYSQKRLGPFGHLIEHHFDLLL